MRLREPLHYVGMLRSAASWAKVARELLQALVRLGQKAGATEMREDRFDPSFPLPPTVERILGPPPGGAITFTFSKPTDYPVFLAEPPRLGILVCDSTRWPAGWVSLARDHLERAIVPSSFCENTLVESGFPANRVTVIRHGVSPDTYHARARQPPGSRSRLRLLFVGTPAIRKGLDILLDGVTVAFSPKDPVALWLQVVTYPDAHLRPYLDPNWLQRVRRLRSAGYRIHVCTDVFPNRNMARLYRSADLACQPFRAEGFCLPLLEAMACGTPVLATAWGGPTDFVDDEVGFPVREYTPVAARSAVIDNPASSGAMIVEPDVEAVAHRLRQAFEDRERLAYLGRAASQRASAWTWEAAATALTADLIAAGLGHAHP